MYSIFGSDWVPPFLLIKTSIAFDIFHRGLRESLLFLLLLFDRLVVAL